MTILKIHTQLLEKLLKNSIEKGRDSLFVHDSLLWNFRINRNKYFFGSLTVDENDYIRKHKEKFLFKLDLIFLGINSYTHSQLGAMQKTGAIIKSQHWKI